MSYRRKLFMNQKINLSIPLSKRFDRFQMDVIIKSGYQLKCLNILVDNHTLSNFIIFKLKFEWTFRLSSFHCISNQQNLVDIFLMPLNGFGWSLRTRRWKKYDQSNVFFPLSEYFRSAVNSSSKIKVGQHEMPLFSFEWIPSFTDTLRMHLRGSINSFFSSVFN